MISMLVVCMQGLQVECGRAEFVPMANRGLCRFKRLLQPSILKRLRSFGRKRPTVTKQRVLSDF